MLQIQLDKHQGGAGGAKQGYNSFCWDCDWKGPIRDNFRQSMDDLRLHTRYYQPWRNRNE